MSVSVTESFLKEVLEHLEFIREKFYDEEESFEWDEIFEGKEGENVDTLISEARVFLR